MKSDYKAVIKLKGKKKWSSELNMMKRQVKVLTQLKKYDEATRIQKMAKKKELEERKVMEDELEILIAKEEQKLRFK